MFGTLIQALLWSFLLIEIEGRGFWAGNLPTVPVWKDLTLFHLYKGLLCVWVQALSGSNLVFDSAFFFLAEETFYVSQNPFLGLHRYTRQNVHQNRVWWWGLPRHIYACTLIMLLTDPLGAVQALLLLIVSLSFSEVFAPLHYAWYFRVHPKGGRSAGGKEGVHFE